MFQLHQAGLFLQLPGNNQINFNIRSYNKSNNYKYIAAVPMQGSMFQLYQAGLFFEHCVGGMGPLVQPAWSCVVTRGWEAATKLVSVSGIQRSVAHAISSLQARPLSQVRG